MAWTPSMTEMTVEDEVRADIKAGRFIYVRCSCRIHKTLMGCAGGRCGICNELISGIATQAEYEAQRPL